MNDHTALRRTARTPAAPAYSNTVTFALHSLTFDRAFTPREGLSKEHVHELARALRNIGDLDPIMVWIDPVTGKPIILDGRHRFAAYRLCKATSIPARVLEGSRKDARLGAARENAKTVFPWTTSERTQYAWGLVIEGEASKAQIVNATGVGRATVGNMRSRKNALAAAGTTPTGNWWRDRNDNRPIGAPEEETDEAKQARIGKLREWLNGVETRFRAEFGCKPTMDELGVANRWHLGQARFKAMASGGYLIDEDEFASDPDQHPLAPLPNDLNDAF
jgi:hypothetical protein